MEKIQIGQEARLTKIFSTDEVEKFAFLSLDMNPVHLNQDYAAKTIFKKRIVHGLLTSSLISAVIGTKLPGEGAIYLHQELDFRKPVYCGEEITAIVKVVNIKSEKSLLYLDTICVRECGEVVIEGKAIVKYVNER